MKAIRGGSILRVSVLFSLLLFVPLLASVTPAQTSCTGTFNCDDLNACTVDSCDQATGFCRHEAATCNDGNPCTADSCVPWAGCQFSPLPAGTACDDANPCSVNDACSGGSQSVCSGTLLVPGTACNDTNACTVSEFCTAEGQCLGTSLSPGTGCDDQNPCTSGDACTENPSGSGNVICQGTPQTCDDGDPCTQDACNPASGLCAAAPKNCDDGNVCTQDTCSAVAGGCVHTAQTGSCSDGHFCTIGDTCSGGNCRATGPFNCSDNIPCTTDLCFESPGRCQSTPNNTLCPPSSNACVLMQCVTGSGCVGTPLTGTSCSDGNTCTTGDTCNNGLCQSGTPLDCNDSNACTVDSCTASGTCTYSNLSCDDGNVCTTDSCNPATGCTHSNNTLQCDDHNLCTLGDTCKNGTCQPGTPLNCDDGNPCTSDECGLLGCIHRSQSLPCDDGIPCTTGDMCRNGVCAGTPVSCNDGDACTVDSCIGSGICEHLPLSCDDGDVCTTDSCNPAGGCAHGNNTGPCSDGNPCTVGDTCSGGACQSGTPGGSNPTISVSLNPAVLSPAKHQMVDITATVSASDSCGGTVAVTLVSIVSNEPDDAPGQSDGHTTGDIQGADFGTPDFNFQLRAERDSKGTGRVYEVTYQAMSPSGVSVTATATVSVPKGHVKTISTSSPSSKDVSGKKKGGAGEFGGSDAP